MAGTELGVGYVSILPSMRGFAPALNTGLQGPMMSAGQKSGSTFGSALLGTVGKVVKAGSIGATIFGGIALKSGLDRLTTIQNATASLTTIMGDAGKAAALMGQIKKTVQGTPFNLDQFADAGKNLVAMNIAGAKVPGILTAIGDAAATSGKGAEGVSQLVDVFGKMAAQGQVSLDQIWSISATGVPALQILANGFHTTTGDMKDLISKGAVPAGKAIDILTQGIEHGSKGAAGSTIAFAGAMTGLRQTFTGAWGGFKAAMARGGAAVIGPFLNLMTQSATGAGELIDTMSKKFAPTVQAAANDVASLVTGLTGAKFAGVGKPLDAWVAKGEKVRAVLGRIKDGAVGLYAFIAHGDFTAAFSRAFGVQEDSKVVDYMFKVRDAVKGVVASFRSVDLSSVSSALSGTGAAFSQVGGVLKTVKDNASVLKPAVQDLGSAMAGAANGGGTILANLLHIAAGAVDFFAHHTGLATAVILALATSMIASKPIMNAYRLAFIVRTPLMIASTAATWLNYFATRAQTKAIAQNTLMQATNQASIKTMTIWQTVWAAVTKVTTFATKALGNAMKFLFASPMGLLIVGIALLVAGLVLFFTKTETGRKIIAAVWAGIKRVVGAVVSWFTGTVWPAMQAVWEGIATGATWLWSNVLKPVFIFIEKAWLVLWAGIKAAWNFAAPIFATIGKIVYAILGGIVLAVIWLVKNGFQLLWTAVSWAWKNVGQPLFTAIGNIVTWLWWNVAKPAWALMQAGFQALWSLVSWAWSNVGKPIFDAIGTTATWLWWNVVKPAWDLMKAGFNLLWTGVQVAWRTVGKPVFDAIGTAISWVWKNVIKPTFDAISSAWSTLWGGLKGAFTTVWDGVKSGITDGINAVIKIINTFTGAINTVLAKLPGGFKIGAIGLIGMSSGTNGKAATDTSGSGKSGGRTNNFATGGVLPGYTPGRDVHSFWSPTAGTLNLSGGEGILVPEAVRALGGAAGIAAINATYSNRVPSNDRYFAGGGMVYQSLFNIVKNKFPWANLNSGYRPGANDFHGQGKAVDLGRVGMSGGNGTPWLAAMNTWIYDTFGKGTAELIYDGIGDNRPDLKYGRPMNYGAATSAQHHNHVHWAVKDLADLKIGGLGGGGDGGVLAAIGDVVSGITSAALGVFEAPAKVAINALPAGIVHDLVAGGFNYIDQGAKSLIDHGGLFDDGGLLQPGRSLIENRTRVPEAVLTSTQWQGMYEIAAGAGQSDVVARLDRLERTLERAIVGSAVGIAERNDAAVERQSRDLKRDGRQTPRRGPH